MKILVVEDERHKIEDLTASIVSAGVDVSRVSVSASVRDAVLEVHSRDFDLVVLDMALPTFGKTAAGGGGGLAQASGGLEVLRTLQHAKKRVKVIVVTQYPDVLVSGSAVKIGELAAEMSSRYNQDVVAAILYSYSDQAWRQAFEYALKGAM